MDVSGANGLMMFRRKKVGERIRFVLFARAPIHVVLALAHAVADPIESHVDCFGAFLFDGVVGNAGGGAIVSLDRRGRL